MQPGIPGSETIYDPFVGSSTTCVAAHQLGRLNHEGEHVMDATATHAPAPPAPAAAPTKSASKQLPSPAVLAVWEAEDGRCEACARPMDKTCAQVGRDKRGERRLVCPDCKTQQPDPLAVAVVGPKTAAQLAAALGTTLEAASTWLAEGLRAAGVLLRVHEGRRIYWLPGVGTFALYLDRPGRPPLIGGPLGPLYRELAVRVQPQARTRGLPRLRAPGTAPPGGVGEV